MYTLIIRNRTMIDRFTCIDREQEIKISKAANIWRAGGLLYVKDGFKVNCYSVEDILHYPVEFKNFMEA